MNKMPYYTALIEEITKEDQAPNKTILQNALLAKLKLEKRSSAKKEKEVDTKEFLQAAVNKLKEIETQLEKEL